MKHFDEALIRAKEWSMDERNNIGQGIVTQSPTERENGEFSICADCSAEEWIVAKFIDGKRIK